MSTADSANVVQFADNGTADGSFRIVSNLTHKVVEVSGGSTADGAIVTQWADLNLASQRWRLVPGQ
jgi:hypothetical protein